MGGGNLRRFWCGENPRTGGSHHQHHHAYTMGMQRQQFAEQSTDDRYAGRNVGQAALGRRVFSFSLVSFC